MVFEGQVRAFVPRFHASATWAFGHKWSPDLFWVALQGATSLRDETKLLKSSSSCIKYRKGTTLDRHEGPVTRFGQTLWAGILGRCMKKRDHSATFALFWGRSFCDVSIFLLVYCMFFPALFLCVSACFSLWAT